MQKINFNTGLRALAINLLLCLFTNFTKAQTPSCSFNVINDNGNCDATVLVEFYDSGNLLCNPFYQNILAGQTYPFSCGACGTPLKNVFVTLIDTNSGTAPASGPNTDRYNQTVSGSLSGTPCGGFNYTLNWQYNLVHVGF